MTNNVDTLHFERNGVVKPFEGYNTFFANAKGLRSIQYFKLVSMRDVLVFIYDNQTVVISSLEDGLDNTKPYAVVNFNLETNPITGLSFTFPKWNVNYFMYYWMSFKFKNGSVSKFPEGISSNNPMEDVTFDIPSGYKLAAFFGKNVKNLLFNMPNLANLGFAIEPINLSMIPS